jgi:hypothetical protein
MLITMPYLPAQEPPAIIMQMSAQAKAEKLPTDTFSFCKDVTSTVIDSADNSFIPISGEIPKLLGIRPPYYDIGKTEFYKISVLKEPMHGQVRMVYQPAQQWIFNPTKGYAGGDKAEFLVEAKGRQFRVIVNFWVMEFVPDNLKKPICSSHSFLGSGT